MATVRYIVLIWLVPTNRYRASLRSMCSEFLQNSTERLIFVETDRNTDTHIICKGIIILVLNLNEKKNNILYPTKNKKLF